MNNNDITTKFKDKVKLVRFALLMAIAGFIFIVGGTLYSFNSGNPAIQIIGVILFIGGIVLNSISWRCPVCKKPLPHRQSIRYINYCSNCSAKLK